MSNSCIQWNNLTAIAQNGNIILVWKDGVIYSDSPKCVVGKGSVIEFAQKLGMGELNQERKPSKSQREVLFRFVRQEEKKAEKPQEPEQPSKTDLALESMRQQFTTESRKVKGRRIELWTTEDQKGRVCAAVFDRRRGQFVPHKTPNMGKGPLGRNKYIARVLSEHFASRMSET